MILDRRQQQIAHAYGSQIVCLVARCSLDLARRVRVLRADVLDAAFPLANDTEPVDLFDLIGATS